MPFDLRPLTLAELLDRSFMLYRRHFRLFVGLMAVPTVFTLLLAVGAELFQAMAQSPEPFADADPATVLAGLLVGVGAFLLIFAGYVVSYMATLGATTLAVSELYVGRTATIAGVYSRMRGQVGRLLVLLVLVGLRLFGIFVGGTVAVILVALLGAVVLAAGAVTSPAAAGPIVGLGALLGTVVMMLACTVFSLRYAVSVPALALENVTARESIRRSVALTRGNRIKAGVLVVFAMVVTYGALMILQGPFMVGALMAGADTRMALWLNLLGAVAGSIGGAITGPVVIIALALLYYDIRIRNEGLDLQLMMANLDQKTGPPTSAA